MSTHSDALHALAAALACDCPGCPAREDATPSLSVRPRDHPLLVECHSGCPQDAVLAVLRARGLWPAAALGRFLAAGGEG